jgi:uncharacterized membrane protein
MSWKQYRMLRQIHARPRLVIATVVALTVAILMPTEIARHPVTRWLLAWNAGTVLYVLLAGIMMTRSSSHQMRRRAQAQDDGQIAILALTTLAAIASLIAIAGELTVVKDMHGYLKGAHIALAGITVMSSWAFIQVMFALHYAHQYYGAVCHGRPAVLSFPGGEDPDYGEFFYFAAVIGTSGQTADVSFVSKPLRRIGSLHCILAYLFNTTVLALLINIGAGIL